MLEVSKRRTAPRSNSSSIWRTRSIRYCRSLSKSTRISQSTPITPGAGLVATGNSLIVVLSARPEFPDQGILQIGPIPAEAVRVTAGRLRSRRLQPPDHAVRRQVPELVNTADARPREVTRLEVVLLAVEDPQRLALQEQVCLLEGMIVRPGEPARDVLDHEHGVLVRPEVGVDHHLHGDPAVDQEGGAHRGALGQFVLGLVLRGH